MNLKKMFNLERNGVYCIDCDSISITEEVDRCPKCESGRIDLIKVKKDLFGKWLSWVFWIQIMAFLTCLISTIIFYSTRYHPAIGIITIIGIPLFLFSAIITYKNPTLNEKGEKRNPEEE
jgi:hypothetical protein